MVDVHSNIEVLNETREEVQGSIQVLCSDINQGLEYIKKIWRNINDALEEGNLKLSAIISKISELQANINVALNMEPPNLIEISILEGRVVHLEVKRMKMESYIREICKYKESIEMLILEFKNVQNDLHANYTEACKLGDKFIFEYSSILKEGNRIIHGVQVEAINSNLSREIVCFHGESKYDYEAHVSGVDRNNEHRISLNSVCSSEEGSLKNVIDSLLANNSFFNSNGAINNLVHTEQIMHSDVNTGERIYNEPESTIRFLDCEQGKAIITYGASGKKESFRGTCGIVSVVNIVRLSGKYISEQDAVLTSVDNYLCDFGTGISSLNGGTNCKNRKQLLDCFGIDSYFEEQTVDNICKRITEGRGIIISIDASKLYGICDGKVRRHAIVPISVTFDKHGEIKGFYICDSNVGMSRFCDFSTFIDALTPGKMNVTKNIIR